MIKSKQYYKFCLYGFLKNLRFFDAFFILFLVEGGLPYFQIGALYAIREIITNIFEIPSGLIADTFGRKNALAASLLSYILSFLLFYYANNFGLFLIAFSVYGIADAFRSGTNKGMIIDYLKLNGLESQKTNYFGHTRSWAQKGSAVSALIAGFIVFTSGNLQHIFIYSIIPYILNFALILSYPKELNHSIKSAKKLSLRATINDFLNVIKQPKLLGIIHTSALYSAYLKAIKDYIQPVLLQLALFIPILSTIPQEKKNGLIIGSIYFLIYLATSKTAQLSGAFAKKKIPNIAHKTLLLGFTFGVAIGLSYHFQLWIFALIFFTGVYLVENLRKPILTGFLSDNVPNKMLTTVISVQSQLKTILTAILALTFGLLADKIGLAFSFLFLSLLLTTLTLVLDKKLRKWSNP